MNSKWARRAAATGVAAALGAVAGLPGVASAATPAISIAHPISTWTGAGTIDNGNGPQPDPNWSNASNWVSGAVPTTGSEVVFPELQNCPAATEACYSSNNNLSNPQLYSIALNANTGSGVLYQITGNTMTVGGGITDVMSNGNTADFVAPLELNGNQTWTVTGGESLSIDNPVVAAPAATPTLTVNLASDAIGQPTVNFTGNNEVGAVSFTGGDTTQTGKNAGNNGIVVFAPDASGNGFNATSGQPVTATDVALNGSGAFPTLTVTGGLVSVGDQVWGAITQPGKVETASASFDSASHLTFPILGPASGTTATAATDYGQLTASGAVDLGGAGLEIANFDAAGNEFCPAVGTVYSLVSAASVTGQLSDANGNAIPDGGVVMLQCPNTTTATEGVAIHYSTTAVTATVVSPPAGADTAVSATTTDPNQPATATDGGYQAIASGGTGTVIVSTYNGSPVPTAPNGATGRYFDVRLASGSTFTKVVETATGVASGTTLYWYDPSASAWKAVAGDPGPTVSSGTMTVTLDASSSPNLGQLTGTIFGVGTPAPAGSSAGTGSPPPSGGSAGGTTTGYHLFASDGGVFSYDSPFYGSMGGTKLNQPIVGAATAIDGKSYYLVARDGGVFTFGPAAKFYGSAGAIKLNQPIVGMAVDQATGGYWLVAADGGVFAYNAPNYGSMGGKTLNQPVVGIVPAAGGSGYYLVARDGGIFNFGPGAQYYGSTGNIRLNQPIVGGAIDPVTGGYWLVAADGGVFSFNAPFEGSTGGIRLTNPIKNIAVNPASSGYWLVGGDGGVFSFNAPFEGSTGSIKLNQPIVGLAAATS